MGRRLVLWDIDRTLIDVDDIGHASFATAFLAFAGLERFIATEGPGRTEWRWFLDTCEANGVPGDAFPRFCALLGEELRSRVADMRANGRVLPGVRDILRRCAEHPDLVVSVLTGNSAVSARLKLETFGLTDHVDLASGAYGDDHHSRAELVAIARRRAADRTGLEFTSDTTVLVGDSPNDIAAARHGGAAIVAVATGLTDAAALSAAGAPVVLPDLTDTDTVLAALLG